MGRHGASTTPYAWHLAAGTPEQPAVKARIDATGGFHAGHWAAGGGNYAQWFEWADGGPAGENRAGLFVTLQEDRLAGADEKSEYVLGVVTDSPAFLAGDAAVAERRGWAPVALLGRVLARDNGRCRPNACCRPGPGGIAVPASDGYRVLRRLSANTVELVLK